MSIYSEKVKVLWIAESNSLFTSITEIALTHIMLFVMMLQ